MSKKRTYQNILDDWAKNKGTTAASPFKEEYELLKLESERKRNTYLFVITIAVSIASVGNLIVALSTYYLKLNMG